MSPPTEPLPAVGEAPEGFRSGFASIVGRPNVGKSTLLNQILRRKVSITSPRPQTTRNAIRGVLTTPDCQIVFIDTPGLHKPQTELGRNLNKVVRSTLREVDAVLFLLDASQPVGRGDAFIAKEVGDLDTRVLVVLNKVDLVDERRLRQQTEAASGVGAGWPVYAVSARSGAGVAELLTALVAKLPTGPVYYPPDEVTDQPEAKLIAEFVREKLLLLTREEVPHSIAVVVEEMRAREDSDVVEVDVIVYVERSSQKGIVIGKGGRVLREVGTKARAEIEPLLGSRVYLDIRVKVEPDWQKRGVLVNRFGYGT